MVTPCMFFLLPPCALPNVSQTSGEVWSCPSFFSSFPGLRYNVMGIYSIFSLRVQKGETLVHHAPGYRESQHKKESFTQTQADSTYTLFKEEQMRFHT